MSYMSILQVVRLNGMEVFSWRTSDEKGRPKGMNIDYGKKHAEDLPIISVLSVVAKKSYSTNL